MTKINEACRGIWPEKPVSKPKVGDTIRYPSAGKIARGRIDVVGAMTVHFTDGGWAYIHQLSKDED